jgi:hypothetical protein
MAEQTCPSCGATLPQELGQHALTPTSGLVACPSCGETVTLERPASAGAEGGSTGGEDSGGGPGDYFAGEETIEGVMDEIERKEEA